MTKPRVLVVDDRATMVGLVVRVLEDLAETVAAASVREALDVLDRDRIDAVVCDLRLPDGYGLDVLSATRKLSRPPPFILMTAFATVDTAVAAMRAGAYDYVTKPFDPDDLRAVVEGALVSSGRSGLMEGSEGLGPLLGQAPKMVAVFDLLRRVAPTDSPVLVLGEIGTGKDLVARAIHDLSPRAPKPFFAADCSGTPRELLEAELFGRGRGAFTGARSDRAGLLEMARGSTLLLDEIADLPPSLQARLTRLLEPHDSPGAGAPSARIVATSRHDLKRLVKEGQLREDLWYRLGPCAIELPALRERKEDIPLLAARFLSDRGPVVGARATKLSSEVIERLVSYDWPGNVRELRNVIERAALLEPSDQVEAASLPAEVRGDTDGPQATDDYIATLNLRDAQELARDEMNRRYLAVVLRKHAGDVSAAAEAAGVERESVYRLLRKYGLSASAYREARVSRRRRGG